MESEPPRCPNTACCHHRSPTGRFFWRHGAFRVNCRSEPVRRFRCRSCHRSFSWQTFRHDRYDKRPECNEPLFRLLTSGVGLRQSGRLLELRVFAVQRKLRKLGRTCELLQRNLCRTLPPGRTFLLDEEETYEAASIRTVTMPVLIERTSWFVVGFAAGPIRRLAARGTRRRARQDRDEARHGRRRDSSKTVVRWVLRRLRQLVPQGPLLLQTDEKRTYASLLRRLFGPRAAHDTTRGRAPRTAANPLFPINTTLAMTRDNCGRLRRKSWLVSKRRQCLVQQMHLFVAYRNYVRRRFNRDARGVTSARILGIVPRALRASEVVRWRQDWGPRSVHPLSLRGDRSVADMVQGLA